ncbi:MAG: helix-turn-helix transcriptional regulator [Candidatus Limiplasma sp.]|nr:helix-turn-helix transcriptional regulator [Candidatus Limiplasma sp.]
MAMQNQAPNSASVPTTHKDYVTVVARHELGGRIRPVAYQLSGGSPVKIDCITDERQAASLKSGGQGTRYTCKVTVDEVQSDVYLFHDEELWFMEAIQTQGAAPGVELAHVQLRKARRAAGLSQNEVARQLGMDVLEYCKLEGGCEDIDVDFVYKVTEDIKHKEPTS